MESTTHHYRFLRVSEANHDLDHCCSTASRLNVKNSRPTTMASYKLAHTENGLPTISVWYLWCTSIVRPASALEVWLWYWFGLHARRSFEACKTVGSLLSLLCCQVMRVVALAVEEFWSSIASETGTGDHVETPETSNCTLLRQSSR